MKYLAKQRNKIEELDIKAIGSNAELIEKVESRIGLKFPEVYKEFCNYSGPFKQNYC